VNRSFITGAQSPCGVAVDATHIYWANSTGFVRVNGSVVSTIGRAKLDGTAVDQSFIRTGAGIPQGVAVS
jgi:virginiamycin B lyase